MQIVKIKQLLIEHALGEDFLVQLIVINVGYHCSVLEC